MLYESAYLLVGVLRRKFDGAALWPDQGVQGFAGVNPPAFAVRIEPGLDLDFGGL